MASTTGSGPGSPCRAVRKQASADSPHLNSAPRSCEREALALAAAGLGVFEWNVASGALTGSDVFAALTGGDAPRTLAELLASVHPEHRAALEREMRAAAAERRTMQGEFRFGDAARERWLGVRMGAVCGVQGTTESLVGIAEDLTARKRAEAEQGVLVHRERELRAAAERANRAKDEFLSMFSHELRSPLNAILGWNSILAAKRAGDADVTGMTARIERSAKAQLKMVNDLLDLGRISTGKLKIEPRATKLPSVVAGAIEAIRPSAEAKDIELTGDPAAIAAEVWGDPDRLQQVVWNLLANAVKFTDPGGCIEVRLRSLGPAIELSVIDTGQGISSELLPHVFDRFRQGDSSTTRHTSGLGLGLALVREIVALHGGSVSAWSEGPGRGATFSVRLPVLGARKRTQGPEVAQLRRLRHPALDGLSILVVDDELDARTVVAETLRLEGARVVESESAAAALERLSAGDARYDVVVTDIGMPAEDGYSLVRKLRRTPCGERMIAIALTGYASQRDREAAIRAGFDVHVAKPVDFDRFVPLIASLARAPKTRAPSG